MTLTLRGRRLGFSLEEIRQWLLLYNQKGTSEQYQVWIAMADRQLSDLERQRAELDETIADLRALRDETQDSLRIAD